MLPMTTLNSLPTLKLSDQQKLLVETRLANSQRSVGLAYLLLLFTLVGHNFYLGSIGRGIAQLLLSLLAVGLVWVLVDLFLLAGMVRKHNGALRNRLMLETLAEA
jgi:TM2 domain-containing membrane protein YozV